MRVMYVDIETVGRFIGKAKLDIDKGNKAYWTKLSSLQTI